MQAIKRYQALFRQQVARGCRVTQRRPLRRPIMMALLCYLPFATLANEETVSINMHGADITAVIQWIAEQTNKKIVLDPRVKGKVTVLADSPMPVDQAYEVFLTMLDIHGYAAAESGGILRIFPASHAKTSAKTLISDFEQLQGGEQVLYVFQAKRVSASRLVELLQPLMPSTGHIAALVDSNSLLLAARGDNVKRLVEMVKRIDESGDLDVETLRLEHATADNVAGLVQSLIPADGPAFSIVSDIRSNSLVMSGDPATRQRVKDLVQQLDQPIDGGGNTRVTYLHYLDAAELVPILEGMSLAMQQDQTSAQETPVSIQASESANAVIMTAPPYILDEMAKVIAQVDIRRAQILVEAIIVEVSKDFSQTLGVEWSTSFTRDDGFEAVTNFGLRNNISVDGDGITPGRGFNLGFYRNGSLRALLQAVADESDANILSTPSIMTLDNQEAEILVGSNVPFITGQITGVSSTTTDPFTTIERQDIGLTLKITPQVNEGDSITLDVLQEVETISDSVTTANDIVTNKRSIKTKVLVEDKAILVLGGLVSDDVQQLESKVPLLGDIPILGNLFKTTTDRVVKKNLMVFIHPVIVDSEEIAQQLSSKNYSLMKALQKKYNRGEFAVEQKPELSEFIEYKPRVVGDQSEKDGE